MRMITQAGAVAAFVAVVGLAAVSFAARRADTNPSSYAPVSAAAKMAASPKTDHKSMTPVTKTDAEWKKILTPEEYRITREQGTEMPESSPLTHLKTKGVYRCVDCGFDLFTSDTKFDSGTGWPSFWAPIAKDRVKTVSDTSDGMTRDEVRCPRCGAHLGHVFDDGPQPTGLRYCMDGVALQFVPSATTGGTTAH